MSHATHIVTDWTFEKIRSNVCSVVSSIKQRMGRKISSHFNVIPLTLEQVTKYCDWNREIELWYRPLPASIKGLTIWEQGAFILVCNAKEKNPLVRLKIILHELAHYLLHRSFLENGASIRARTERFADHFDKEANLFALMAMVPDDQVRTVCNEQEELEDQVRRLEGTYAFTREEAVVRIAAYDGALRNSSYQEMFERFLGGE